MPESPRPETQTQQGGVLVLGLFRTRGAAVAAAWVLLAVAINGGLTSWRGPNYPGLGNQGHGFGPPPSDAVYFLRETLRGATFVLPLFAGLWAGVARRAFGWRVALGVGAILLVTQPPHWRWMAYFRWPRWSRPNTFLFVAELEVWLFALLAGLALRAWLGVTYGPGTTPTRGAPRWGIGDLLGWTTGLAVAFGAGVWFDRSVRGGYRLRAYLENWLEPGYVGVVALSVMLELIAMAPLMWALLQERRGRWKWIVPAGFASCGLLSLKVTLLGRLWLAYREKPAADLAQLYPDALALAAGTTLAVVGVLSSLRWAGCRITCSE